MDNCIKKVFGYKAFNSDHTNKYGVVFKEGMSYKSYGKVSFGVNSTGGFHMCERLEDTLQFFEGFDKDSIIAEVVGSGMIIPFKENSKMYSVEKIFIKKFLSRQQMLNAIIDDIDISDENVCKFIRGIKMNDDEIDLFKYYYGDSPEILQTISSCQEENNEDCNKQYYR